MTTEEGPTPPSVPTPVKAGGLILGLVMALALIIPSEGKRRHAYLDTTATPTICYGETYGVTLGQVATDQQCLDLLKQDLTARIASMQECTSVDVAPEVAGAMIDFAYNAGVEAYCGTPATLLNAGKTVAACNWLGSHYTTSRGIKLRGLVNRRQRERALCLKGAR